MAKTQITMAELGGGTYHCFTGWATSFFDFVYSYGERCVSAWNKTTQTDKASVTASWSSPTITIVVTAKTKMDMYVYGYASGYYFDSWTLNTGESQTITITTNQVKSIVIH